MVLIAKEAAVLAFTFTFMAFGRCSSPEQLPFTCTTERLGVKGLAQGPSNGSIAVLGFKPMIFSYFCSSVFYGASGTMILPVSAVAGSSGVQRLRRWEGLCLGGV